VKKGRPSSEKLRIDTPRHPAPGKILRLEFLDRFRVLSKAFAAHAGISRSELSEILSGERNFSAENSRRIALTTGKTARYWLELQLEHELALSELVLKLDIPVMEAFRQRVPAVERIVLQRGTVIVPAPTKGKRGSGTTGGVGQPGPPPPAVS